MRVTGRMMSLTTLNDLQSSMSRMSMYQRQLSSLRTINKPSDNPIGAGKSMSYRTIIEKIKQYQNNVSDAKSLTSLSDSVMGEINNIINRVKTLSVQAADNSLSQSEKQSIALEMKEIQDQVLRLSNGSDGSRYFFAGTNTSKPAFEKEVGIIYYKGNQNEIKYQLDDYVSEGVSSIGSDLFSSDILGTTTLSVAQTQLPLAAVPGLFPPVQAGTFTINGKVITIDPAADSLADIAALINDTEANVDAQITDEGKFRLVSTRAGTDFTAEEGTSNFLLAMGMTAQIEGGTIASSATPLTLASNFNNDAYNILNENVQMRWLNNGAGITIPPPANSFNITDSDGNSISVDLSGLTATSTLADFEQAINQAVNAAPPVFNVDRIYVDYSEDSIILRPSTDSISITEGAGTTAAQLGIAGRTGTRTLPVTSAGLDPLLGTPVNKSVTSLGSLFNGVGPTFPLGSITITDDGVPANSLTIDLSGLSVTSTIADVENTINEAIADADSDPNDPSFPTTMVFNSVSIDVEWDTLSITVPHGQFNITDAVGTTAAQLGIVTGGLTGEFHSAVRLEPEMEAFRLTITKPDASLLNATIDMTGVDTVQEFLDRINSGAITDDGRQLNVRAYLNEDGTGFNIYALQNEVKLSISNAEDTSAETLQLNKTAEAKDKIGIFDTLSRLSEYIADDNVEAVTEGLEWIEQSQVKIIDGRTTIGARVNRVKLIEQRHLQSKQENMALLSDNEDADMTEAAMMFAMMQQTYQAGLQAAAKVLPMSLVNFL